MGSVSECAAVIIGIAIGATLAGAAFAGDERDKVEGEPIATRGLASAQGTADPFLPELTRSDIPADSQPSLPGYRNEATALTYRWWVSSGRARLGVGVGTLAYQARPTRLVPGLAGEGAGRPIAGGTFVVMGLRFHATERTALFADASSVRGQDLAGNDAVVAKVGLEFKSAQSRWNVAYGGLALRLAGDARMTVRLRRGGLGLYMRSSF